jgi:hypothetical protein
MGWQQTFENGILLAPSGIAKIITRTVKRSVLGCWINTEYRLDASVLENRIS